MLARREATLGRTLASRCAWPGCTPGHPSPSRRARAAHKHTPLPSPPARPQALESPSDRDQFQVLLPALLQLVGKALMAGNTMAGQVRGTYCPIFKIFPVFSRLILVFTCSECCEVYALGICSEHAVNML